MNTIIPWILGGLVLLFIIGIILTIRFWRESKVSPYYFLRRQAEQKMHTYSLGTVGTAILLIFFVSYARQPSQNSELRMAVLTSTKPNVTLINNQSPPQTENTIVEIEPENSSEVVALSGDNATEISADLLRQTNPSLASSEELAPESALAGEESDSADDVAFLPPEFDQISPSVSINNDTVIQQISFSNSVDENTAPISPRRLFDESLDIVYATFDYDKMADGMVWSWVWRHNGQVIGGGNQEWAYGEDGPGYIYLSPETGFLSGEYEVEIWVNGELLADGNMVVTDDLATTR